MTKEQALREVNDEPQVVLKHGRIYWSTALIGALVAGGSSYLITRAQVNEHDRRIEKIENAIPDLATKKDVERVGDRVDALYDLLIEKQDAHPRRTP